MRAPVVVGILAFALLLSGELGSPVLQGQVAFSTVERENFDALAVSTQRAAPSDQPLVVRVNVLGDAASADLATPFAWLEDHANIVVERDPNGAPLYLTSADLAATSGRSTLGATVPTGMAVEVAVQDVAECVVAHELLHFVGLKHVNDRSNIMYPHCYAGFLERARLTDAQLDQLASVREITATTPHGVIVWASR